MDPVRWSCCQSRLASSCTTSRVILPPLHDVLLVLGVFLFDAAIITITHPPVELGNDRVDREQWKSARSSAVLFHPPISNDFPMRLIPF